MLHTKKIKGKTKIFRMKKSEGVRIFCDMDGVLCDFDKQFQKLIGYAPEKYEEKYGSSKFFKQISNEGEKFWSTMGWTSDGKHLWNNIKKYNIFILSAPIRDKSSITGKKKWLKDNIDISEDKVIIDSNKQKYAKNKNDILTCERNPLPLGRG